ncbi:bifunctional helix-turn-helix transcriptional regulator/GNAT family N-acetyltransferase [Thioclava atlantica]|uniref:MarR family transcriptional regulator n=1 Tax=Thioclava atlantica TaxID=1317124 RepID=A0A085TSA3_9RHOB|nr:bifunctional helix-turn-helix transcriptional regulator/GNAT family N-acetyltransferase [Thioclava atlantica]KFE33600.1 MarR family transcriptional regulator [Thioclava atlantica]
MSEDRIAQFREFNRFHTRLIGALNEHLLASDYTLPQVRVLYEVANAPRKAPPSARDLGEALGMDTGYLSRIVTGLAEEGLIDRVPSDGNAKRLALTLSDKGREVFKGLNDASAKEAATMLEGLSDQEQRELIGAMWKVRRLLGNGTNEATFILRDPEPGDLGWITYQHGRLYAKEYGWDWTFEALVAEIVGQFAKTYDPSCERCWVAEREGEVIGSVFVVRQDDDTAKLRLLYVDESARGLGLGRRLVEETLRFARAKGYKRMILWTNDVLVSARRIYEAARFELLEEEPHHSFGKDLVGQVWGRDL